MDLFLQDGDSPNSANAAKNCSREDFTQPGSTDTTVQLVISLALGFSAFFAFCVC